MDAIIHEYCKNEVATALGRSQYTIIVSEMSIDDLDHIINRLRGIVSIQIGVIDLSEKLDLDVVTDIFIRINSKGTALSQGDFVMSKMAENNECIY